MSSPCQEPENPVAAQSKNLETSEPGGQMMQCQCKTEGLEVPKRVTSVSLHWKAEEARLWWIQTMAATIEVVSEIM